MTEAESTSPDTLRASVTDADSQLGHEELEQVAGADPDGWEDTWVPPVYTPADPLGHKI